MFCLSRLRKNEIWKRALCIARVEVEKLYEYERESNVFCKADNVDIRGPSVES